MAIPGFQAIMLPLLKFTADGKEHHIREAIDILPEVFGLSEQEKRELLPSGNDVIFGNRVKWSRSYLLKAGLLESTKRGYIRITKRGLEVLGENPGEMNIKFLEQIPKFAEWKSSFVKSIKVKAGVPISETVANEERSPEELLEYGYLRMREELAKQMLTQVKEASPSFFERLVVELLVKMGYGGSMKDAGEVVGKSGDGGIDGVIKEDRLGLDIVYIQAKKWGDAPVGRPKLQEFVGALKGQRANKGVFITTSSFTREAEDYVSKIDSKVVLIDGAYLAELMIDYDVGVSRGASYEIKRIDSDYFSEE